MTLYMLGVAWIGSSVIAAPVIGRSIGHADATGGQQPTNVIHLFPPKPPIPGWLSPRAGSGTRRFLRRLRRSRAMADLRTHGALVGLLLAGVLCVLLTRGEYVTWSGVYEIPTGSAR